MKRTDKSSLRRTSASLQQLRKELGKSQTDVANQLKVRQSEISKIESRKDLYISTLQEYIAALGGSLELIANFPDNKVTRISQFDNHSELLAGQHFSSGIPLPSAPMHNCSPDNNSDSGIDFENNWYAEMLYPSSST